MTEVLVNGGHLAGSAIAKHALEVLDVCEVLELAEQNQGNV